MNSEKYSEVKECLKFIDASVSCYHVVENAEKLLKEQGFVELKEAKEYSASKGGNYYIKRNDSSLIALKIPEQDIKGFHIMASHSDSPTFKLKAQSEQKVENNYVKLNVEPYGGMIYATWLDRILSVAGRVVYQDGQELKSKTVNIDEDLLIIPNLAIHMNREMNKQLSYNPQIDLQPVIYAGDDENVLMKKIGTYTELEEEDILGKDLYLYVREKGKTAGAEEEMVISPRLDDLECVYATLKGLLAATPGQYITMCAIFDNEEVGSLTRQGASSTFLKDSMERIVRALQIPHTEYLKLLAESFMISADNAHALHPNHPEKADATNRPCLNKGIVIKYQAGQKYTTDAYTEAVIKSLCIEAQVPYQAYCNRSDVPGGSTLGNVLQAQVSIPCVDIGLPQLAMHSAVETAGSADLSALIKVAQVFYSK